MSDTDSFIDEVSEEVRRERLFKTFKKYGWIAVLAVVALVAAASWNEWRKAQDRATSQALGDSILAALEREERSGRAAALATLDMPEGAATAVVTLLAAGEESESDPTRAAERLLALADDPSVPQAYRQIALLKGVSISGAGLTVEDRRERLEGMVSVGGIIRLLAEEQLALLLIEEGKTDEALAQFRQISEDAETTITLQQRVAQMIVALGGDFGSDRDLSGQATQGSAEQEQ